jgi:hypothetical protein
VPEVEKASSEEKYAIQLLPAESNKEEDPICNKNHLVESMLEEQGSATGTFRIESTGFSGHEKRSLIATFRNANFVSYVWYSKYETFDPSKYGLPLRTKCENFYKTRPGESECQNNYFITGESVNGPMHTEDHVGICGSPAFGRTATDRIEFGQLKTETLEPSGYSVEEDTGCSAGAHPVFKGTHILANEVKELQPPPGDEELVHIVEPKYHFFGKTEIILTGKTMTIIEHKGAGFPTEVTKTGEPYPSNGVIYVSAEGGCEQYLPFGPQPSYSLDTTCGNAYVHGKYENSLTIASQNDVVINENITTPTNPEGTAEGTPTTNALLGLIANNFVRVYHPVAETYEGHGTNNATCNNGDKYSSTLKKCEYTNNANTCDAPNAAGYLKNPIIYAAILALKHAVVVDNYACGESSTATLGHLNVYGAVAGLFSNGLTGEFNGSSGVIEHGYPYNANYDNRLQIEEPPHFLNPIQADWYIQRQTLASNP